MSAKQVVDAVWDAMESDDFGRFRDLADPDIEVRYGGTTMRGVEELTGFVQGYKEAFPDLRHEVVDYTEAGDTIALELHVKGTHSGTLRTPEGEIPATGREVLFESCDYVKVRDGRIASWHVYNDQLAFMAQLGLAPQPA